MLIFSVAGIPIPQGSHKAFVVNGRPVITQDNAKTEPWRVEVKHAAIAARGEAAPLRGAVEVDVCFVMPRPKHHYGTGRNAGVLRDGAPKWPTTRPDTDKLARALLDALTASGAFSDDSQVVHLDAWKVYVGHEGDPQETPAAHVVICEAR